MIATKVFVLLGLTLAVTMALPVNIKGGIKPVTDLKKVEDELNLSLTKLAAGDGPNYKLGKVYSATTQTVSGSLTRIEADLVDEAGLTEKCNVSIWSQPWLDNGIQVTFECKDKPSVVKHHNA